SYGRCGGYRRLAGKLRELLRLVEAHGPSMMRYSSQSYDFQCFHRAALGLVRHRVSDPLRMKGGEVGGTRWYAGGREIGILYSTLGCKLAAPSTMWPCNRV